MATLLTDQLAIFRRVTYWVAIAMVAYFTTTVGLAFTLGPIVDNLHKAICPADTFLPGGGAPRLVGLLSIFSLIVCCALLLGYLVTWGVMSIRSRRLNPRGAVGPVVGDDSVNTRWQFRLFASITVLLAISTNFVEAFSVKCLTPSAIYLRQTPWGEMKRYSWNEVREVGTSCDSRGEGRDTYWDYGFWMTLNDGTHLGLGQVAQSSAVTAHIPARYVQLARSLRGVPAVFDNSNIQPGCVPPDLRSAANN